MLGFDDYDFQTLVLQDDNLPRCPYGHLVKKDNNIAVQLWPGEQCSSCKRSLSMTEPRWKCAGKNCEFHARCETCFERCTRFEPPQMDGADGMIRICQGLTVSQ